MTFHDHMAGANSVRAFLNGFPRLRTNADFRAVFRREAEIEIERLITALDLIDGDPDDETGEVDEASLGWGLTLEGTSQAYLDGSEPSGEAELEDDAGSNPEEDVGDDGEPDEDREPILGWAELLDQRFSVKRMGDTDTYDEEEAG
jgi:hypothetical protein